MAMANLALHSCFMLNMDNFYDFDNLLDNFLNNLMDLMYLLMDFMHFLMNFVMRPLVIGSSMRLHRNLMMTRWRHVVTWWLHVWIMIHWRRSAVVILWRIGLLSIISRLWLSLISAWWHHMLLRILASPIMLLVSSCLLNRGGLSRHLDLA